MTDYSFEEVGAAVDELHTRLGHQSPAGLMAAFSAGLHPNLLSYEKGRSIRPSHTALDRCLIGARSTVNQPVYFYDIFGACRQVKIAQLLNYALKVHHRAKTKGVEARIAKLKTEMRSDAFDAIVFELLVGARYAERPGVAGLEYVDEDPPRRTPDIKMRQHGRDASCECKKLDRSKDFAIEMRASANAALAETVEYLRARRASAVGEVSFHEDPSCIQPSRLRRAFLAALDSNTPIVESGFVLSAQPLPRWAPSHYKLYPSPEFAWERYGYRVRDMWMGLVHEFVGALGSPVPPPRGITPGSPSWLSALDWDCGIKWRVSETELFAKYRRFAFNTLKNGLPQLAGGGGNSVLHAWLESDYFLEGRADVLEDFRQNLSNPEIPDFGWFIVNETLLDVSPKGSFDMIEHGHYMRGPTAVSLGPELITVFAAGDIRRGAFGIGVDLPDIDAT